MKKGKIERPDIVLYDDGTGKIRRCKILQRYRNGRKVKRGGDWFDCQDPETGEVFALPHFALIEREPKK